ncbi:MAG: EAL domain-containing protein [Marinicella sp.]
MGFSNSVAAEKIVLQLKWEHGFQFAGYYAAQWQGYYQQQNLEVETRSAVTPEQHLLNPIEEVVSGSADFGIGDLDILKAIDQGEELLILAPLFQKAPTAIVTLKDYKIESINDLIGLRVGMLDISSENVEAHSMFRFHGVDPGSIKLKKKTPLVEDLVNGSLDAIVTYGVSAEYQARELGVDINLVYTAKFGTHFFGDVLYTRKSLYEKKPEVVKSFLNASLKGWEYALNNQAEIVDRISTELPRYLIQYQDFHGYNRFFSEHIANYIQFSDKELGFMDFDRWNKIYNDLKYIGVLQNQWNLADYIFKKQVFDYSTWLINSLTILFVILTTVLLVLYQQTSMYRYLMIFVLVTITFAYYFFEKNLRAEYQQQLKFQTLVELESIKSNLLGLISSNISLLKGFATHISYNPTINHKEFNTYAEQVFEYGNALVNFAAAPDLVVNMVYPLEGNEGVIGLDYTKNSAQIDAVLNTTHTNEVIIAGPLNLIQGGDAIVARVAVFEKNDIEKFWGIISAPIDLKVILSLAGVFNKDLISELAIKKMGEDEKMVHGNQSLLLDEQAINVQLEVGDTTWTLHARPSKGWDYPPIKIWLWRFVPLILTLFFFYFLFLRNIQREKNRSYKKAIKRNERLLLEVGELAHVGGWRVSANSEFSQWTAVSKAVLGEHFPKKIKDLRAFYKLFSGDEAQKVEDAFYGAIKDGIPFDLEVRYVNKAGQQRWVRLISDEIEEVNKGYEVTGAIQDITYYKNINELIEYQATHDTLTGLYNRYSLHEEAAQLINEVYKTNGKLMALFIDIDDFKNINDTLGHHAGDLFLKVVASALKKVMRDKKILARYSGDEFVAIKAFKDDDDIMKMIHLVLSAISKEFDINGTMVLCSCSVGVAIYPEHSNSIEDLVSKADMAMYSAKQKGKNGFEIYSSALLVQAERKAVLKTALQHALIAQDLDIYFQPVVNLINGEIEKFEALLRWFDQDGNPYDTEEFITIAEKTGLVVEIDLFILRKLSQYLNQLNDISDKKWNVAINVSPIMFNSQKKILDLWFAELEALQQFSQITIEITERTLMENPQKALQILNRLVSNNIQIAIDDFGVGYSSLNYLTKFPIQIIKIDKSFTDQIGTDEKTDALIKTILSLATDLQMKVVAEGIEKKYQFDFLSKYQCQFGQGHLFSKPVPFNQACELSNLNHTEICQIKSVIDES